MNHSQRNMPCEASSSANAAAFELHFQVQNAIRGGSQVRSALLHLPLLKGSYSSLLGSISHGADGSMFVCYFFYPPPTTESKMAEY